MDYLLQVRDRSLNAFRTAKTLEEFIAAQQSFLCVEQVLAAPARLWAKSEEE